MEYTLLDINEEGYVTLMDDAGNTREDLSLPKGTDELEKVSEQINDAFGDGKELTVQVLKAMNEECIMTCKVIGE